LTAAEQTRKSLVEREGAIWPATIEAADSVFRQLERALAATQTAEGRLLSLVCALREAAARADDDGNGALAAASKIEERIIAIKRRGAPRVDPALGRSLIERLRLDPGAEL
jgi:hypothetical protein